MKRLLLSMLTMMMLVISGCGDTSVAVIVPFPAPPSITSFRFSQDRATEFINGSIDFIAPDSDIDTITVSVFNSDGTVRFRTESLLDLPRVIQGTVPFTIDYVTYPSGSFTFSVFLTDFNGNTSNLVGGAFSIP